MNLYDKNPCPYGLKQIDTNTGKKMKSLNHQADQQCPQALFFGAIWSLGEATLSSLGSKIACPDMECEKSVELAAGTFALWQTNRFLFRKKHTWTQLTSSFPCGNASTMIFSGSQRIFWKTHSTHGELGDSIVTVLGASRGLSVGQSRPLSMSKKLTVCRTWDAVKNSWVEAKFRWCMGH